MNFLTDKFYCVFFTQRLKDFCCIFVKYLIIRLFAMRIFVVWILVLVSYPVWGQSSQVLGDSSQTHKYLELNYPGLHNISAQGQTSFLVAISYFPELANLRIQLKHKKIRTTLNVRPTFGSLVFNRKNNRKYIIRINSSLKDSIITLNEVPSDAQIGLIGHELSHIVDYRTKNFWGVISRAFAYLSKQGKTRFEKEIDGITIKHGLGRALYQWSNYVLHHSDASSKYKLFKSNIYMKPDEIRDFENAETLTPR